MRQFVHRIIIAVVVFVFSHDAAVSAYSSQPPTTTTRRGWFQSIIAGTAAAVCQGMVLPPDTANAAAASTIVNPLPSLVEAQKTLDILLQNWKRATVDCTFADVPRELLETKNKELLLEKASTFALFDKSVSVETCKTTNRLVRDYLGVTGKGPLVGMDKRLKRGLTFIDPDDLDDYVMAFESFSQSYSKASSLSYTSGVADFDSVNNFAKEDSDKVNVNSNLEQAKEAIVQAKTHLDTMVGLLQKEQQESGN